MWGLARKIFQYIMDTLKTNKSTLGGQKRQMNNQKDTQKTEVKKYGQPNVSDINTLSDMPVYNFANKKTEKLVTALYLVSDCMDTDDAIKGKLRLLGVELLSDIYKLSIAPTVNKQDQVSLSINHIYELLSLIEIANNVGFISEMNTMILKNEFSILVSGLKDSLSKDKQFAFRLDEKMFDLPEGDNSSLGGREYFGSTISHQTGGKKTPYSSVSFMNTKSPLQILQSKKINSSVTSVADRQDRTNRIVTLIKEKKDSSTGQAGISIKDISLAFTDCSEKTIQRELNTLVSKGQIKKTGSKRWSRYIIIES